MSVIAHFQLLSPDNLSSWPYLFAHPLLLAPLHLTHFVLFTHLLLQKPQILVSPANFFLSTSFQIILLSLSISLKVIFDFRLDHLFLHRLWQSNLLQMLLENSVLFHWCFSDSVLHSLVIHQKHVVAESQVIFLVLCHHRSIILSLLLIGLRLIWSLIIWNIVIILLNLNWHGLSQKRCMLSIQIHQSRWLLRIVQIFGLLAYFLWRLLYELSSGGLALVKSSQLLRWDFSLRIVHLILLHWLFIDSLRIQRPTLLTNCSPWSIRNSCHWLESLVIYDFWLIIICLLNGPRAWVILWNFHWLLLWHVMLFKRSLGLEIRLIVVKRMKLVDLWLRREMIDFSICRHFIVLIVEFNETTLFFLKFIQVDLLFVTLSRAILVRFVNLRIFIGILNSWLWLVLRVLLLFCCT